MSISPTRSAIVTSGVASFVIALFRSDDADRFTLPDATHLLMVEQPDAMAAALTHFFETHPIDGRPIEVSDTQHAGATQSFDATT